MKTFPIKLHSVTLAALLVVCLAGASAQNAVSETKTVTPVVPAVTETKTVIPVVPAVTETKTVVPVVPAVTETKTVTPVAPTVVEQQSSTTTTTTDGKLTHREKEQAKKELKNDYRSDKKAIEHP